MKKSLLIASVLYAAISSPLLAQDTKTYQPPTVEKLTFQQSLQRDRAGSSHRTLVKPFSVPGFETSSKQIDYSRETNLKGRRQPGPHGYQSIEMPRNFMEKDPTEFILYSLEGIKHN